MGTSSPVTADDRHHKSVTSPPTAPSSEGRTARHGSRDLADPAASVRRVTTLRLGLPTEQALTTQYRWKDLGEPHETDKTMTYWLKPMGPA